MEKKPRPYRRLDKSDRVAIENGLNKRKPCRQMARGLGRSPWTIADEVARNHTVSRGPGEGGRAPSCCRGRDAATGASAAATTAGC